jgi:ribosomal protein L29
MEELKKKTEIDLIELIAKKREDLRSFRFGSAGSRSKNVKEGRTIRKEIARAMTELSSRK